MITSFSAADVPDQAGKTFFITGANTGIGFEAAKVLARRGARVLLGCRSRAKAEDGVARIVDAHPSADIGAVDLDLGELASIRNAAEAVAKEPRLDALVNNAGIMDTPKMETKDGFEAQFGVNHLGHFALTGLLLPTLEQSEESRIVTTSSLAHRRGDIDFGDIDASKSYSPQKRYYQSKLANLLFMYELDRRLRTRGSKAIAVAAHPGLAATELGRHQSGFSQALMRPLAPLLNSAEAGAWPTLAAATDPAVEGGQYFGPGKFLEMRGSAKQVDSSDRSKDPALAKRLWDLSIDLTGVDPGI
jgi:NAD(P)-dependent dehydrogenase (short-subunit alcohol dehydrogenase family)